MSARLDRFLFAPVDPFVLRAFRASLAAMLAFAFWPRARVLPAGALARLQEEIFLAPGWWALCLLLLLGVAAGRHPRAAGLLSLLALLPLAFLSRGERSRQILLVALGAVSLLPREGGPIWPIRLIQLQLSVAYGANAIAKSTAHYLSGEALAGMSESLPNFLMRFDDGVFRLGPFALSLPAAAAVSVAAEYLLAAGVWVPRARYLVALLGVAFHFVLTRIVAIFLLDAACIFLYLSFLLPFGGLNPRPPDRR